MKLMCPECKNEVNLSIFPNLKRDDIVECDTCGITLMIADTGGDDLIAEIVDEGK